MRLILAMTIAAWSWSSRALECTAPAVLKQNDGSGNTLHSWCEVEGKHEGPYEIFAVEGGLQLHAEYKNGQLNGPFRRYDHTGKLATEGGFFDGKMAGEWTRYREDGSKRDQGTWKDDRPAGAWKFFAADGKLERETAFETQSFRNRLDFGLISAKLSDHGQSTFPGLGFERSLLGWAEWLNLELTARFLHEKTPDKNDGTVSMELGFSLDLLRRLTSPFNLYLRGGPHFADFKNPHIAAGVGIRYLPNHSAAKSYLGGVFIELTHVEYGGDYNQQQYGNSSGPNGNYGNGNQSGENLFLGTMYSF